MVSTLDFYFRFFWKKKSRAPETPFTDLHIFEKGHFPQGGSVHGRPFKLAGLPYPAFFFFDFTDASASTLLSSDSTFTLIESASSPFDSSMVWSFSCKSWSLASEYSLNVTTEELRKGRPAFVNNG